MEHMEMLNVAVTVLVLGVAVWLIKHFLDKFESKLDSIVLTVHALDIKIGKCVTWEDLAAELRPMKAVDNEHERRLSTVEAACHERHRRD